jgi:hypothetical protein
MSLQSLIFILFVCGSISAKSMNLESKADTVYVEIKPFVLFSDDTVTNYFFIESENLLLTQRNLNQYLENESKLKRNSIGVGYFKKLLINSTVDTLEPYFDYTITPNTIDSKNERTRKYNLKADIVFNLFDEVYSEKYVYLISIEKVIRSDFKYFGNWFYTLIKINLTQQNGCNFYFHTKSVNKNESILLVDSVHISNKKLNKIKANIESTDIYNGKAEPTLNNSTNLLIIKGKGYIYETLNKEGSYTIGLIEKYARKHFGIPYIQKQ